MSTGHCLSAFSSLLSSGVIPSKIMAVKFWSRNMRHGGFRFWGRVRRPQALAGPILKDESVDSA